jgi:hypothetical protein
VRFSRSTNEVFSFTESSDSCRACCSSNYGSPLDLDYPIVPAHLDHLTVDTRWPKDSSDDSFVELESVGGDQRGGLKIHSIREVAKQVPCVMVASFADYARRPKPRPNVDHNEDPDRLLLAPHDGSDLVGLKFYDGKSVYFQIIEPTTAGGCPLQAESTGSIPVSATTKSLPFNKVGVLRHPTGFKRVGKIR